MTAMAPGPASYALAAPIFRPQSGNSRARARVQLNFSNPKNVPSGRSLGPAALQGIKSIIPEIPSAQHSVTLETPIPGIALPALVAEAPFTPALPPAKPRQETPGLQTRTDIDTVTQELQPELQAAGEINNLPREAGPGIGRRILDAILRRKKSSDPDAAVIVDENPGIPASGLQKATGLSQDRSVKPPTPGAAPSANAVLEDIAANPPTAVILDYDGTLVDRGPTGISLQPDPIVIKALIDLLKTGIPVALLTGRSLDTRSPIEDRIPMSTWDSLISKIPTALRRNLYFSGRIGSEFSHFDEKGNIIRDLDEDWTPEEKIVIAASIKASLRKSKVPSKSVINIDARGLTNLIFPSSGDKRLNGFVKHLSAEFKARDFPYLLHNTYEWVYFSRRDKSDGMRMIFAAMKTAGHPVSEDGFLFVGDSFKTPRNAPPGGDAAGALAFPKSRAVTVGDDPKDVLPPNVRRLGLSGAAGTLAVINTVIKTVSQASAAEMDEFYRSERKRSYRAAAAALSVAALPWLWSLGGVGLLAGAGSVLLTLIGIPQIIKNFKEGRNGTKDLAPASTMIWFGAAVLLTVASLLRGASPWWLAANVAGVVESLVILLQINAHRKNPALAKTTGLVVGGFLLAAAPMLLALGLPAAVWASLAFNGAMALLLALEWPQIRRNYLAYKKDKTVPSSISWQSKALVVLGSALSAVAAVLLGDFFWLANSLMGVIMPSITLGQIFLAKTVNAALEMIMPLALKIEKALLGIWGTVLPGRKAGASQNSQAGLLPTAVYA